MACGGSSTGRLVRLYQSHLVYCLSAHVVFYKRHLATSPLRRPSSTYLLPRTAATPCPSGLPRTCCLLRRTLLDSILSLFVLDSFPAGRAVHGPQTNGFPSWCRAHLTSVASRPTHGLWTSSLSTSAQLRLSTCSTPRAQRTLRTSFTRAPHPGTQLPGPSPRRWALSSCRSPSGTHALRLRRTSASCAPGGCSRGFVDRPCECRRAQMRWAGRGWIPYTLFEHRARSRIRH